MLNIFTYEKYQDFLKDLLRNDSAESSRSLTASSLAACLGVTGPTVSKMLSGALLMQEDHIYLLAEYLKLNSTESEYLSLLGQLQRTGLETRRKALELRRIEIQRFNHNTPSSLKTEQVDFKDAQDEAAYYTNPWAPIVHIYLTLPRFQNDFTLIAGELGLSKSFLLETIELLKRIRLIEILPSGVMLPKNRSLHSANLSHLSSAQQMLTRAISLQQLSSKSLSERYSLSVTFSTDANTHEKSRQLLINCINEIHQLVKTSKPEQVYHLTIDLFDWTKKIG